MSIMAMDAMAEILLLPLMVGSITAATLTLNSYNTLEKYAREGAETSQEMLLNLVSLQHFHFNVKRLTFATVIVFLLSEVTLVGHIAFNHSYAVGVSYVFFFTGVLLILYTIIYSIWIVLPRA